ncbi:alpha/beta hydrolase family protein [uncultured Corynebacterium sp.]|mgnify:CR=1 FL=1|uniref:alpha/beta hydrolase n=1 Tax=uncultured Corynebacterium sp. TaxID=159447 RepID=UPI0025921856|nr:alpha/beta hydrolase-fold protein [uncultured Corynebacterium sp.]
MKIHRPVLAEEKAGEDAPALEAPANTAADEEKALQSEIIKDAEKNSASTPEEQRNMPSLVAAGVAAGAPQPLTAAPLDYQGKSQEWYGMVTDADHKGQWEALKVYSPSMERDIPVTVRWAEDGQNNRIPGTPTVYLLNGAGGSEQNTDWVAKALGRVESTFGKQGVNLVIPMEGAFAYYVDWLEEPAKNSYYHGKQMWTTFLGDELPQSIEPYLGANYKRAAVGFSMSATSSLLLAEQRSGNYAAVGSFSGPPPPAPCPGSPPSSPSAAAAPPRSRCGVRWAPITTASTTPWSKPRSWPAPRSTSRTAPAWRARPT